MATSNGPDRAVVRRRLGGGVAITLPGLVLIAACAAGAPATAPLPTPAAPAATVDPRPMLAGSESPDDLWSRVPALATREAAWSVALASAAPILPFGGDLDAERRAAQDLALAQAAVQATARDAQTGVALRAEVMQVRPVLPADVTAATAACRSARCHRVEIYNHATNATLVATVDVAAGRLVAAEPRPDTQPEIPDTLADLAAEIAIRSPEVIEALGEAPAQADAGMPNVKTALNGSRCERSRHLCVAPTFIQGDRALWAIVDLTDGRLVGTRWTELGQARSAAITEKALQDEVVMARYCERSTALEQDGWSLQYRLTPSDGLELTDVRFQGRQVMRSAKLVDWHVSYSGTDGFGYSDAVGCPQFSTASVVAFNGPVVEALPAVESTGGDAAGFAIVQDFRSELWPAPCNYRYTQRFELYRDGRFRVGGANLGRGCGNQGTYRPVLRIDVTAGGDGTADTVSAWDGAGWQPWSEEGWRALDAATPYTPDGYQLRILDRDGGGFLVEPNRGQMGDGSHGDDAWVYVTRHHADEGDGDLLTIGPCCNADHRQGPEKFMTPPESVAATDVVLWYVPQLVNSDVPGAEYCWAEAAVEDGRSTARIFPCAFGPRFVPIGRGP